MTVKATTAAGINIDPIQLRAGDSPNLGRNVGRTWRIDPANVRAPRYTTLFFSDFAPRRQIQANTFPEITHVTQSK